MIIAIVEFKYIRNSYAIYKSVRDITRAGAASCRGEVGAGEGCSRNPVGSHESFV